MTTTTVAKPLFRRRRTLDDILSRFTRAAKELDVFIDQRQNEIADIEAEENKLKAERAAALLLVDRASRTRSRLVDLVA